jgi:hypothetical protein
MRASFRIDKHTPSQQESSGSSQSSREAPHKQTVQMSRSVWYIIAGIAASLLLIGVGIFIARVMQPAASYTALPNQPAGTAQLSDKEVKALVDKVGTHIILPSETPRIVQIANVEQLRVDQPFFRSALNDDQLLVYPNRVILYRPSTDQVVDVAQIRSLDQPTAAPSASSSSSVR